MQNLLTFFITTLVFWAFGMFGIKILFAMMQDGGAFDVVFGWGKMRNKLWAKGNIGKLAENALGYCEQCTSFWWSPLFFIPYYIFCKIKIGWIADGLNTLPAIALNVVWFTLFWFINAGISHRLLIYRRKEKDKKELELAIIKLAAMSALKVGCEAEQVDEIIKDFGLNVGINKDTNGV